MTSEGAHSEPKQQKCESKRRHPVIVQAGGYAAEMFAAHTGRQRVLGLVVVGDLLYIWRYDRQGAIQCSAHNFIEDLPRFVVLLFAMQRFQDCHRGLNPSIDPKFEACSRSPTMTFHDQQGKETDIELELSSDERRTHFGLNGRATNVFPATSETLSSEGPLIARVFWAEESRKSEPDILQKVYEIAGNNNVKGRDDVEGHVPAMVCYQKYLHTSTALIRKRLGLNVNGFRVLYVIVFRKLEPITALTGDDFLRAWWDTVRCHFVLWTNGVRHRDVSPSNLMYRIVNGKIVGVLNDFDLASLGGGVTGTERTGTVPFMALDLLTEKALRGEVMHLYEHDAESFIWVLTWISLRYSNGQPMKNKALDKWLIVDAVTCMKEKLYFLRQSRDLLDNKDYPPGKGHERHLWMAQVYLSSIQSIHAARNRERQRQSTQAFIAAIDAAMETSSLDCMSLGAHQDGGSVKPTEPEDPETVFTQHFIDPIDKEAFRKLFVDPVKPEHRGSVFAGMGFVELTPE
ncbi:hypothetical protein F5I97DRAFT_124292 [Phlebopus sp. FC_14]|nr:hypothetical protein F5I97DRAFT_124292 [Phlebopus sp. FC_14]